MDQWGHQERQGWVPTGDDPPLVRAPKTAELIADHFRAQIAGGALVEGEFLPSEGMLTEALGIARPTLREALRILETEGLIAVARGARTGAKVLRPTLAPVLRAAAMLLRVNQVTIADLLAARLVLETDAVGVLAAAPDKHVLAALHSRLAAARRSLAGGALGHANALLGDFALLLVSSAGNATLAMVAALIRRLLTAASLPRKDVGAVQAALRAGERLLALIAAGDAPSAAAHWRHYSAIATADWLADGVGERVVELPSPR